MCEEPPAPLRLPVTVELGSESALRLGAAEVVAGVRPAWARDCVRWKVFTDGITNKLIGGWLEGSREDTVLVRVYGEGTERIIDRQEEMKNMQRMQSIGCGGKLYAAFDNGICYEFLAGSVMSQARVWEEGVWRGVARALAKMHGLALRPAERAAPCLWGRLRNFVACCDPGCKPRLSSQFLSKDQLLAEVDLLEEERGDSEDTVVFCHNDALLANVVIQPTGVQFIDLEYGAANYAAFDIANHFVEFVGCEGLLDYATWLPSPAWQSTWLPGRAGPPPGRR
jgi:ethanolamine kinase